VPTSAGFSARTDASCPFTATSDLPILASLGLGALADNGGPTRTHLPAVDSPLRDAIPASDSQCTGLGRDQRGLARPADAACDIGAVERQPTD
jgi:hypothetical protein